MRLQHHETHFVSSREHVDSATDANEHLRSDSMPPKPPQVKKPPGVSKAAQRARNGDLGAKLELTLTWLSNIVSGKEKVSFTQLLVLGVVGALVIVGAGGLYMYTASQSVRLSVNDEAAMKSVFMSGQPWLVECTTGGPSDVLYKAESKLKGKVQTAVLDCGAKLKSGKTVIQRFKLKTPGKGTFIIAVSNLELPTTAGYAAAIRWPACRRSRRRISAGARASRPHAHSTPPLTRAIHTQL